MTDELTPQEKEAFDKLPRERMPAGLEERVVGAMRERGILAGRRRTIVLSNARVAGLLAASVAVIIGAYSIGLHRGDGTRVLPPVETARTNEFFREDAPAVAPLEVEPPAAGLAPEADRSAPEKKRQQVQAPADEARAEEPQMAGGAAEPKQEGEAPAKDAAEVGHDVAESAPSAPAPSVAFEKSALRARATQDQAAPASNPPLTFYLNGTPVIVEAPDSVRVTQDEQGRMLIIYTSDGVIRIRLADDN